MAKGRLDIPFDPETDVVKLKLVEFGAAFYVPKTLIEEIKSRSKIHTLNFELPDAYRIALAKAAGMSTRQVGFRECTRYLTSEEVQSYRKSAGYNSNPDMSKWLLERHLLQTAQKDIEFDDGLIYFGMGPASEDALNPISDPYNINSWFWYHVNYLEHVYHTQGEAAYFKAMGYNSSVISVTGSRKKNKATSVTINTVPLIDLADEFNVFDQLAKHIFINGVKLNKIQSQAIFILMVMQNYSDSMGQIRAAMRGSLTAPSYLEEDTGQLVYGEEENTTVFWVPRPYYPRSPIAEASQKQQQRFAKLRLSNERLVITNNIIEGIAYSNAHWGQKDMVRSVLAAGSKPSKAVARGQLINANRCSNVNKRGKVQEAKSPLCITIQEDGVAYVHTQLKYVMQGGLAMFGVKMEDSAKLSSYLTQPTVGTPDQLTADDLYQEFDAEVSLEELELKAFT